MPEFTRQGSERGIHTANDVLGRDSPIRDLAKRAGIGACWSMPILSQERPEADLIHEARTDKLTKLLNRHTTETQLQKIIATGLRHRLHVGVRF